MGANTVGSDVIRSVDPGVANMNIARITTAATAATNRQIDRCT